MFISRKDYDELNARNVELARQVRDLSEENNQLRDLRVQEVHNNTVLLEKNTELTKMLSNIKELSESNNYGKAEIILAKINDLVRPLKSKLSQNPLIK